MAFSYFNRNFHERKTHIQLQNYLKVHEMVLAIGEMVSESLSVARERNEEGCIGFEWLLRGTA